MLSQVKKNRLILLGIAVGMAVMAGLLVNGYLSRKASELEAQYASRDEKVSVVVPKRDLPNGTIVQIGDFAIREIPAATMPPDAILPQDMDRAEGQSLRINLPRGRPILFSYLSSGGEASFSELMEDGKRALTIQVDELNSISGMVRPNDRIDLFVVAKAGENKAVLPLMQDVVVKATGNIVRREIDSDGAGRDRHYSTFTLDLSPDDIGKVLLAQESGELKVALKGSRSAGSPEYRLTTLADLRPRQVRIAEAEEEANNRPPPPPPPPPVIYAVTTAFIGGRGGIERTEQSLPMPRVEETAAEEEKSSADTAAAAEARDVGEQAAAEAPPPAQEAQAAEIQEPSAVIASEADVQDTTEVVTRGALAGIKAIFAPIHLLLAMATPERQAKTDAEPASAVPLNER